MTFGDTELGGVVVYEILIGPLVWLILRARQWKWADFAFHYSRGTTILGMVLAAFILAVWYVFEVVVGAVPMVQTASPAMIVAVSIINPLFEEMIVLAYVVQSMRGRFGLMTAMNVSIAIRLLYHLYQGPLAVIPIALFGVVVTIAYVRLGRLWPVVVAHGLLDFAAFAQIGS